MARFRNITTGVEIDVADDAVAGNLSRWEWEPVKAPTSEAKAKPAPKPAKK